MVLSSIPACNSNVTFGQYYRTKEASDIIREMQDDKAKIYFNAIVDHFIQSPNDMLLSVHKEDGKDVLQADIYDGKIVKAPDTILVQIGTETTVDFLRRVYARINKV